MPIGSDFDDFLGEEGTHQMATDLAMKKVLALQIEALKTQQLDRADTASPLSLFSKPCLPSSGDAFLTADDLKLP